MKHTWKQAFRTDTEWGFEGGGFFFPQSQTKINTQTCY